jgi:hypothetical protein
MAWDNGPESGFVERSARLAFHNAFKRSQRGSRG